MTPPLAPLLYHDPAPKLPARVRTGWLARLVAAISLAFGCGAHAEGVGAPVEKDAFRPASDPGPTLLSYVIGGEMARTRPLVDYCEAAHADTTAELKTAYANYLKTLRAVTVAYMERADVDLKRRVPGTLKDHIEDRAMRCVEHASHYPSKAYCRALLDSFRRVDAEKMRTRVIASFEIIDALLASDRFRIDAGPSTSREVRDCGPSRIHSDSLPRH